MKIGILTFHCAHNYGAVIQCYGLQQYLKSLGHDVYVIDYRPSYLDGYKLPQLSITNIKNISTYIKELTKHIFIGKVQKKRYHAFEDFITQKFRLLSYTTHQDYSDFDAIVVGSDQIWNPLITGGCFDDEFFGFNAKCKVISYAASSRFASLSDEQKAYLKSRLDKIDCISVRESSLRQLLQPLTDNPIAHVIDPSFLPDVVEYENLCTSIKEKKDFVLVYELQRNKETLLRAHEVAKRLGCEVIELVGIVSPKYLGKKFRMEVGPCEFLSYIKNARCIVTTSFHGLALSLKFQKNFYSLRQGHDADLRTESLLSKIGLLSRFVPLKQPLTTFEEVDYSKITHSLNKELESSKAFIAEALNK